MTDVGWFLIASVAVIVHVVRENECSILARCVEPRTYYFSRDRAGGFVRDNRVEKARVTAAASSELRHDYTSLCLVGSLKSLDASLDDLTRLWKA